MVEAFPGRVAVQASGRAVTYDALNRQTNRIAHALLAARGEGSEPVALCFAAAEAAIPAMLGVLKAGKFYVQLDPSYPTARLVAMVAEADARAIVTNAAARPVADAVALQSPTAPAVLDVDVLGDARPDTNLALPIDPDALQYALYTSGSTGAPKGVMHTHRNGLNGVWLSTRTLSIAPSDRFAFLSSVGFTMSEALIWNALLNGASVHPYHFRHSCCGVTARRPLGVRWRRLLLRVPVAATSEYVAGTGRRGGTLGRVTGTGRRSVDYAPSGPHSVMRFGRIQRPSASTRKRTAGACGTSSTATIRLSRKGLSAARNVASSRHS